MRWTGGAAAGVAAAALVLGGGGVTVARAANAYQAMFETECCYGQTLEAGQPATEWFVIKNVGTATWDPSIVHLATDDPQNSDSPFYAPSWLSPNRAAALTAPVAPGDEATFTYQIVAPSVAVATSYVQYFGVVADGVVWMDPATGLGPGLYEPWRVVPDTPPTVSITSAPTGVTQGQPITVDAVGGDAVDLDHITMQLDGGTPSTTAPPAPSPADPSFATSLSASATYATSALAPGPHTVTVRAYDGVGETATVILPVSVTAPTQVAPAPQAAGLRVRARLTLNWSWKGRRTRLARLRINAFPHHGTMVVACAGRGCPLRRVSADAQQLRRLRRRLTGRVYRAGDRLLVTITAPGAIPEAALIAIRDGRVPAVRLL